MSALAEVLLPEFPEGQIDWSWKTNPTVRALCDLMALEIALEAIRLREAHESGSPRKEA